MDRSFMYWFMFPFIGAVAILMGTGVLAPHLLSGDFMLPVLAGLLTFGLLGTIVYAFIHIRAGGPWAEALNPLATMVVLAGISIGVNFLGGGQGARTGYTSSTEIQRTPGIKLAAIRDGKIRATAVIGGQTVPLVVDAKIEHLLLKAEDAVRLGIDVAGLAYDRDVTVDGRALKGAMVTLPELEIAAQRISKVTTLVIADRLPDNVIGIRPLMQFGDWTMEPAGLILRRPNQAP